MGAGLITEAEIAEEARRARALRLLVDTTAAVLRQTALDRAAADTLVATTRRRALDLFPGRGETFDLILAPRFARIIEERFGRGEGERGHRPRDRASR